MLILSSVTSVNAFAAPAKPPTSEIPEKREFPVNSAVNPCEDFHKYVCSNVEASFKLRDDRSHHAFSFSDSRERLLDVKKKFMLELPEKKNLDERTQQLRDFYVSCMDPKAKATSEKAEVKRLLKQFKNIQSVDELIKYVNTQMPKGTVGGFIGMGNTPDLDNPKVLNVHIGGSLMGLPEHKYYENSALVADYKKLLTSFFNLIEGKSKNAEKRAQAIIDLEKDFIKVYPVAATRRQRWGERHLSSQQDTIKKYPNLKLDLLFKKAPATALVNHPVSETAAFLNEELPKRPLSVWKDYLLVKNLSDLMDDGYPKFFQAKF